MRKFPITNFCDVQEDNVGMNFLLKLEHSGSATAMRHPPNRLLADRFFNSLLKALEVVNVTIKRCRNGQGS